MTSPSMQPQKGKPGNFGKGAPPAKAGEQGKRKPHLMGTSDPSITPTVTWSGNTVTISNIPEEDGSSATGVSIDGTDATESNSSSGTWAANVAPRATGNSMTITYSASLSYSNTNFPSSTSTPRCNKNS